VIAFAKVMEDTLRKHDGKKTHWRDVSVSFGYLFGRVSDEIREAKDEYHVHNPDYHKCVMELVDVANFCMMCYDRIHPADTRSRPHTSAKAPEPDEYIISFDHLMAIKETAYPLTIEERKRICDASRPHTSAPAPEPDGCSFRVAKMDAMYDNGYAEGAKAAREQVLLLCIDALESTTINDVEDAKNAIGSLRHQQEAEQPKEERR
jgi:hypothetical protein